MKPHNLFSVGVLILALALPGTASAQRGSGHSRGGVGMRGAGRPVGSVGRPVMRPTVAVPRGIVRQPNVAGFARPHDFARPRDFGSIGFGSGVRTGFERPPFGTGFVAPNHRVAVPFATGRQAFRSKGLHTFGRSHAFGGPIIVGYPWWADSYGYPYQYDYQTPAGGYYQTPFSGQSDVYGGAGVSAGPSTYWTDLANQPGAASGLTFQVSPASAEVFVDGAYVGTVQDFWADLEPLMIVPGSHRIELRAPGYRTVTLDVTTTAGQVIPYAGELEPLRAY
jgi:PEGA domain